MQTNAQLQYKFDRTNLRSTRGTGYNTAQLLLLLTSKFVYSFSHQVSGMLTVTKFFSATAAAQGTLQASIMRRITKINIEASVSRHQLIFHEEWLDKLDRFIIYFFFSGFLVYPILTILNADFTNPNDKFISLTILPISFLFGLYVIYRKATEKFLFKVITSFDKQTNRQILLDFADKQDFEIHRKSNDCLIFNESSDEFNSSYKKSMIFIIKDNLVLFTILQDRFKLNLPTLTSHLFLRYDLKKLFKQSVVADKQHTKDRNASL